jgi:hypothetical protein
VDGAVYHLTFTARDDGGDVLVLDGLLRVRDR